VECRGQQAVAGVEGVRQGLGVGHVREAAVALDAAKLIQTNV